MREIKFRAYGPNCKMMWDWCAVKRIANAVGWEHFDAGERILMQYTGLKDKNGVEIYEGDVCVIYSNKNSPPVCVVGSYTGEVSYYEGAYYLVRGGKKTSTLGVGGYCKKESCQDVEVIGNIYENPDLLKGDL